MRDVRLIVLQNSAGSAGLPHEEGCEDVLPVPDMRQGRITLTSAKFVLRNSSFTLDIFQIKS